MIRLIKQITFQDNKVTTVYYSVPKSVYIRLHNLFSSTKYKLEIQHLTNKGYLLPDLTPIKCTHCKSTNIESYDHYYDDNHLLVEYSARCKDCNTDLGLWSYGYWFH